MGRNISNLTLRASAFWRAYSEVMNYGTNRSSVGISHVSYWVPPEIVDNREVAERHGFGEDFVLEKLGIRERRVLAGHLTLAEMASNAILELLRETSTAASDVELLILVSQTGDFAIPHSSAVIQKISGVSESALIFDISLGCSGYVIGLDVAIALMDRLGLGTGVLVTADVYSRIVDPGDRGTSPIFGDGASATLLNRTPTWTMGRSDFGSQGSNYEELIVRGFGTKADPRSPLHMDGRAILGFTRRVVPHSVKNALKLNGLSEGDVDKFVFHQANAFVLDTLRDGLSIEDRKIVRSFDDIGNTTSSSIPIAFRRGIIDRPAQDDGVVVISGFGVGLSWSTSVMYKV